MSEKETQRQKSSPDFRLNSDERERVAERAPHATGHWFVFGEPDEEEGGR